MVLATLLSTIVLALQVVVDRVCDDVPLAIYAILINQVCANPLTYLRYGATPLDAACSSAMGR